MLYRGVFYTLLDDHTMKIFETIFDRSTDKLHRPVIRTFSVKESDVPIEEIDLSIVEACRNEEFFTVETPIEPNNVLIFPDEHKGQ
jgi:hypothetical protein